jgi:hypothetical protein
MERFIKSAIEILSVYFPFRNIIRFAYSKYFRNIFNIRNIFGAVIRDIFLL